MPDPAETSYRVRRDGGHRCMCMDLRDQILLVLVSAGPLDAREISDQLYGEESDALTVQWVGAALRKLQGEGMIEVVEPRGARERISDEQERAEAWKLKCLAARQEQDNIIKVMNNQLDEMREQLKARELTEEERELFEEAKTRAERAYDNGAFIGNPVAERIADDLISIIERIGGGE